MNESNDIDLDLLPKGLREIAGLVGIPDTLKIANAFGGTRVWFPAKWEGEHPFIAIIGEEKTKILWEYYRGDRAVINQGVAVLRELRNREIIAKLNTHKRADLAREYNITEQAIYALQRKHKRQAGKEFF